MGIGDGKWLSVGIVAALIFCMPGLAFAQQEVAPEQEVAQQGEAAETEEEQEAAEEASTTTQEQQVRVDPAREMEQTMAWTWIVGRNALAGGVTGGLIGLGFFLLTSANTSPWIIAQFAGGGILVGTGIGLVELLVNTDRRYALDPPSSTEWIVRDAPSVRPVGGLELRF